MELPSLSLAIKLDDKQLTMKNDKISPKMRAYRNYGKDIGRDQVNLGHDYESALGRMAAHPDYAEKYTKIIQEHPFYTNEKEAFDAVVSLRNSPDRASCVCRVWAKIGKDEEYYYIEDNYFIVTDDGRIHKAAEYIGMALLY